MYKPIENYQFRNITGVSFIRDSLQPPTREMDERQQTQWDWTMWKRTGGFNSGIADFSGLEATVSELNTLVGISTSVTVQAQLNGKEGSFGAGTTTQYLRGDKTWQTLNTTAVPEGSNLYYTDVRVDARVFSAMNYSFANISLNFSGIWASPVPSTITYERIGNIITLGFHEVINSATTASFIISSALPASLFPITQIEFFLPRTVDNGSGNFTGAGNSGFRAFYISYSLV
jgi:hypothetical protein